MALSFLSRYFEKKRSMMSQNQNGYFKGSLDVQLSRPMQYSLARAIQEKLFEESCMRDAIRQHITTLADNLPFELSEIPDRIIEEDIATPSESESLRKLKRTEDQVAGLVSLVITKDAKAMKKFLDIVAVHNTGVVEKIRQIAYDIFEVNIRDTKMPCVVCNLKEKCDIKLVYNYFFAKGQISASLHRRVLHSELPVGCQHELWDEMLNDDGIRPDCSVIRVLVEAMEHDRCCNSNSIEMLKRLLRKNEPLKCSC